VTSNVQYLTGLFCGVVNLVSGSTLQSFAAISGAIETLKVKGSRKGVSRAAIKGALPGVSVARINVALKKVRAPCCFIAPLCCVPFPRCVHYSPKPRGRGRGRGGVNVMGRAGRPLRV
jgi:hypothetical protein